MSSQQHDELVARACKWLGTTGGMGVVLKEPRSHSSIEHPDAIGWNCRGWSILVECKVSRADFTRDVLKRKRWAKDSLHVGCGQERYYMTPPSLLSPSDIPDGWGMLEAGGRVRRSVKCRPERPAIGPRMLPDPSVMLCDWPLIYGFAWPGRT